VEDLKERYYGISRRLLVAREGGEAGAANHPLVRHVYAAAAERKRRVALDKVLRRPAQKVAEENAVSTA
jgi:DNA methyltransferase 1-associated protein 1